MTNPHLQELVESTVTVREQARRLDDLRLVAIFEAMGAQINLLARIVERIEQDLSTHRHTEEGYSISL